MRSDFKDFVSLLYIEDVVTTEQHDSLMRRIDEWACEDASECPKCGSDHREVFDNGCQSHFEAPDSAHPWHDTDYSHRCLGCPGGGRGCCVDDYDSNAVL